MERESPPKKQTNKIKNSAPCKHCLDTDKHPCCHVLFGVFTPSLAALTFITPIAFFNTLEKDRNQSFPYDILSPLNQSKACWPTQSQQAQRNKSIWCEKAFAIYAWHFSADLSVRLFHCIKNTPSHSAAINKNKTSLHWSGFYGAFVGENCTE